MPVVPAVSRPTVTRTAAPAAQRRSLWPPVVALIVALSVVSELGSSRSPIEPAIPAGTAFQAALSTGQRLQRVSHEDWSAFLFGPVEAIEFERVKTGVPVVPDPRASADYSMLFADAKVPLTSVFGLDVETIVIDPGHGGVDPGATGALGTREKDVTLDIALRLRERLEKDGNYRVLLTREQDRTVSLVKRVELANAKRADIFVSIHINSLPDGAFNVIETYYFGPPSDGNTVQLAERENRGSEYPISRFRAVVEKIGDTLKRQESAALAHSIQDSLFRNIKRYDQDVLDVGVKVAPFIVLLGVEAPSVLAEISCITNQEEEAKLQQPEYRDKIASFLEEGIIGYLKKRQLRATGEIKDERQGSGQG